MGTVCSVSGVPASFPTLHSDGRCLGNNLLRLQNGTDSGASVTGINFHCSRGLKSKTEILSGCSLACGELPSCLPSHRLLSGRVSSSS